MLLFKREFMYEGNTYNLSLVKDRILMSTNIEGAQLVESYYYSINARIQKKYKKFFKWRYEDVFRKQYAVESYKSELIDEVREIALGDFKEEISI